MSSGSSYRPWRTEEQPAGLLNEQVAMTWTKLVLESRQSIAELKELRGDLEKRMQTGAKLVEWFREHGGGPDADSSSSAIDAIAARLSTLEQRLSQLEAAIGRVSPVERRVEAGGEKGDYILRRFKAA
jgi:hypothetical protein